MDGVYPAQEADLDEHILYTIEQETNWRDGLDQRQLANWLAIAASSLHAGHSLTSRNQLDFLGRRS